jgi:hypothetical protein
MTMMATTAWLGRATMNVLFTLALLPVACGDDGTDPLETGADDDASTVAPATDDGDTAAATAAATAMADTAMAEDTGCAALPQLHIVNDTDNAVEEVTMLACDMSDQSSFPVPPGGLPSGGELTIDLPGPGCWLLGYSGEGCFGDPPGMVEAACGETVEWVLMNANHVCAGA